MRKPMKWVICSHCNGNAKVEHPAFSNGITSSEWAEWDQDERESYFAGHYDVRCEPCGATGKVEVPDVSRMTFAQKREYVRELRIEREDAADRRAMDREMAAERAFGC